MYDVHIVALDLIDDALLKNWPFFPVRLFKLEQFNGASSVKRRAKGHRLFYIA